jgi:Flp pilus assembly CpaF family ATPase
MLRLETLALSAGDASESAIARQLDAAVETVVQIDRVGSERRISGIADIEDLRGWSG